MNNGIKMQNNQYGGSTSNRSCIASEAITFPTCNDASNVMQATSGTGFAMIEMPIA
jgi:hypothetical protein